MFFTKTSLGKLIDTMIGTDGLHSQPLPILVIETMRNEKRLKAFFSGQAPKKSYEDVSVYFQINPLDKKSVSLIWRTGKNINAIMIDAREHLTVLAGMVRCQQVYVMHIDNKSTENVAKTALIPFDISPAIHQFESDIKEPLLLHVLKILLKKDGRDVSAASGMVAKFWEGAGKSWDDFTAQDQ